MSRKTSGLWRLLLKTQEGFFIAREAGILLSEEDYSSLRKTEVAGTLFSKPALPFPASSSLLMPGF
jgi:UPF0716 family protein affecting phage T7 exclusion